MPVKIRLMRIGAKKRPFYRVVAVDERKKRTGGYLELLGTYNPLTEPKEINLKQDLIDKWIKLGAQPSDGFLRITGKAPQRPPRKAKKAKKESTDNSSQPAEAPLETVETPVEEQTAAVPEESTQEPAAEQAEAVPQEETTPEQVEVQTDQAELTEETGLKADDESREDGKKEEASAEEPAASEKTEETPS